MDEYSIIAAIAAFLGAIAGYCIAHFLVLRTLHTKLKKSRQETKDAVEVSERLNESIIEARRELNDLIQPVDTESSKKINRLAEGASQLRPRNLTRAVRAKGAADMKPDAKNNTLKVVE